MFTTQLNNLALLTDSYKFSHHRQYPPGTETVYSYFESRVGAKYPYTVFFGLQYLLLRYFDARVTPEQVDTAERYCNRHIRPGIFNRAGWDHIIKEHDGKLPIRIKAVKEGTPVPTSNVMMTIENTDPKCFWLTNWLETLLVQVWYPSTVATSSRHVKGIIRDGLIKSGDLMGLDFKLHDFGFRGSTSIESAGIGGMAHLVNFKGSDTTPPLVMAKVYYDEEMAAFSIPASEHSTITSWGRDHEVDAYENMLDQYPEGLVACVSDSYDIQKACSELWGGKLREKVLRRDGQLVVRPDSGEIVPTVLDVLERLGAAFGTSMNSKGYRTLDPHVRVIQGDGCTPETIKQIVGAMLEERWSIDNIAFGMGGGLLQQVNRDTQRFAFKCSSITINGKEQEVYKEPKTDPTKNSKRGRLALVNLPNEGMVTVPADLGGSGLVDLLETVYEDGKMVRVQTFEDVRQRADFES